MKALESTAMSTLLSENEGIDGKAFFVTEDQSIYFWDFLRGIWKAAGDTTKREDMWVIPKQLSLCLVTLIKWTYWLFALGKKKPSWTRQHLYYGGMYWTFRIDKIKNRLGCEPPVGLAERIRRDVDWFRKQEIRKHAQPVRVS